MRGSAVDTQSYDTGFKLDSMEPGAVSTRTRPKMQMLEIADKPASVASALIGLIGLAMTGFGLWLQRRGKPEPVALV